MSALFCIGVLQAMLLTATVFQHIQHVSSDSNTQTVTFDFKAARVRT